MHLRRQHAEARARALVVEGVEAGLDQPAGGVGDPPRLEGAVPVVLPDELVVDLGEVTVDAQGVLGVTRPLGPLPAELQADEAPVDGPAGAGAPVPADRVGPEAPPE